MDDDSSSRVRVDFTSLGDEHSFLDWWKDSRLMAEYADTPSGDGPTTFFYFSSDAGGEAFASALRQELQTLHTQPAEVVVEHWMPDEERWSGEPPRRSRVSTFLSDLLDAFFGSPT